MEVLNKPSNRDIILTKRIQELIKWDRRISNSDVHVISKSGSVTLIGKVDTNLKKEAALALVKATKGVLTVSSELEVSPLFTRNDVEIENLVKNRIEEINFTDKEHIAVEVKQGCVKLTGMVLSKQKKARAAGVAWELSGVNDCHNLIRIDGEMKTADVAQVFSKPEVSEATALPEGSHNLYSTAAFAL